jgi:hypothetical protein
MAVQQTQVLPAPFLGDISKQYAKDLGATTAAPLDTSQFAPTVAGQTDLQKQATTLAGTQGKGIGAFEQYLTAAEPYAGPDAYKQFMSPYQQQVIDATMTSFDKQAAQQRRGISDRAAQLGAYGGSRMGVAQSEYDAASDMNRALMESQLLQQGYGQGIAGAQTAFQQQMGQAQAVPGMYQQDISQLGRVGAVDQAQAQAEADATRETARLKAYEPYERLGYLGTGVTGLLGGYPGQYQSTVMPNPTPLQSALGIGATGAGIYGAVTGQYNPMNMFKNQ